MLSKSEYEILCNDCSQNLTNELNALFDEWTESEFPFYINVNRCPRKTKGLPYLKEGGIVNLLKSYPPNEDPYRENPNNMRCTRYKLSQHHLSS